MSNIKKPTHATVSIKDGRKFVTVWCNFDGYIDHLGKVLSEHYDTKEKVVDLISHGDACCINENIGERVDNYRCSTDFRYYEQVRHQCRFYHRDMDMELDIATDITEKELLSYADYNYLFKDGKWFVSCADTGNRWTELSTFYPEEEILAS